MTTTVRLTGQSLIDFVNEKSLTIDQFYTRTDMVRDAGYINDNGTGAYVEFYTQLLLAKQELDPTYLSNKEIEDAEYEALTGTEQEMYDAVYKKFGEKWDHEVIMDFCSELSDIGIELPENLDDAYEYTSEGYKPEAEFAEYIVEEVLDTGIPDIVQGCIDYQSVWDSSLRYDYNTIEFDGDTYFFRNNYWWNLTFEFDN